MLVDTNVLVDVLENDPTWADWSIAQLRAQAQIHRLVINPVIYAELSLTFSTVEALDATLADLQIPVIDTPKPALFLAGRSATCATETKQASVRCAHCKACSTAAGLRSMTFSNTSEAPLGERSPRSQ
ncbi:MAG: type II toxin-antitoxin system VapC family toxin [Burkholderiales bacterium]|jgi:hypothetical protein|uniref:type II toxin-antitoxin system VapC family toxin n=1 Tax=Limnohabitans sp. TaxID=1907725 RepID=UPI0025D8A246|nr:hypothetical protein [Limnohabitans sp.]